MNHQRAFILGTILGSITSWALAAYEWHLYGWDLLKYGPLFAPLVDRGLMPAWLAIALVIGCCIAAFFAPFLCQKLDQRYIQPVYLWTDEEIEAIADDLDPTVEYSSLQAELDDLLK